MICDCQNPEPMNGVALVSNECPIHNLYPKVQANHNIQPTLNKEHTMNKKDQPEFDGTSNPNEPEFDMGNASPMSYPNNTERMLSELVDKIMPGLDTGDLLADAMTVSRALDARPTVEKAGEGMSIAVALSFADDPRPYHTLQAPADTNGELYRALSVLAREYRAALYENALKS